MAESKSKKNTIAAVVAALVVVAGVVTATLLIRSHAAPLNDDFFKSNDTKLVMNLEDDGTFVDVVKAYIVYNYRDDKITGMAFYYQFTDEAVATAAFEEAKADAAADESVKNFRQNGQYIIVDFNESEYANVSVNEVKQAIEFLEKIETE